MPGDSKIQKIFSAPDVKHGLSLFTAAEISHVKDLISEQDGKLCIKCQIKDRYKVAKPEEIVRQLWIYKLLTEYGYPKERIDVEKVIYFGSRVEPGAADIVVFHEDLQHYYILFEVKRPSRTSGLEQLKGYCNAEGAPIGVWSNGNEMIRLHREEPNIFVEIPRIPLVTETLRDILTERWTLKWLDEHDELKQGKTTLKKILLDLEELVLGNAGVDPFEEIFKLIYAKLYDEWKGINDATYQLDFFVGDRSPEQVMEAIGNLLEGAKRTWAGVFEPTDRIELRKDHLKVCVSFLEKIKLFNSNLQIIDEAFEYLIPQVSKKKEGQFFTPRAVVDMVVKMLNPRGDEFVIDPACGSAGFLLHAVMWIAGGAITGRELPQSARHFAQNNIVGIDFAKKAVKISKAINLIVGDGKSHVYKDNSLAQHTWGEETKAGLRSRLLRFPTEPEKDRENQGRFMALDFDVLMTNPPFAGTVKERSILRNYRLAERRGRIVPKIGRHILFLEQSLRFIKPGGRLAIVLPQGLLNNASAEHIRRYVIEKARILAVVGLHGNTFKPHTGTKTSVLFLYKYTDAERKKIEKLRTKSEQECNAMLDSLQRQFEGIEWNQSIDEDKVPDELKAFTQDYFEFSGSDGIDGAVEPDSEDEKSIERRITSMREEMEELKSSVDEKEEEMKQESRAERKSVLKAEIRAVNKKLKRLQKDASESTLSGRISLVLSVARITQEFKKYWLDAQIMKKIDYPIFFGVNQKPLKDNRGEYRYERGSNGEYVLDEQGHLLINHDLYEIADAFVKFARQRLAKKDAGFAFWRK